MRRLLVDHARAKQADKREGDLHRVTLDEAQTHAMPIAIDVTDVLALDQVLHLLAAEYPRAAQVVEVRYFGGMTEKEAAEALESPSPPSNANGSSHGHGYSNDSNPFERSGKKILGHRAFRIFAKPGARWHEFFNALLLSFSCTLSPLHCC